jgi:hypothetical protein
VNVWYIVGLIDFFAAASCLTVLYVCCGTNIRNWNAMFVIDLEINNKRR